MKLAAALILLPTISSAADMWVLRSTLCLKTGRATAECREEVSGPYPASKECFGELKSLKEHLEAQADEGRAEVLFIGAICVKGENA